MRSEDYMTESSIQLKHMRQISFAQQSLNQVPSLVGSEMSPILKAENNVTTAAPNVSVFVYKPSNV